MELVVGEEDIVAPTQWPGNADPEEIIQIIEIDDTQQAGPLVLSNASSELISDNEVTPNRRKRKRATPMKTPPPRKKLDDDDDEDDGSSCPVCYEQWEMTGPHRIISLKCGHLFGESCIRKWFKEGINTKCCPSCKAKGVPRDIRHIYAKKIYAVDKSEEYRLRNQVDEEKKKNADLQRNIGHLRMELKAARDVADKFEAQLKYVKLEGHLRDNNLIGSSYKPKSYKLSLDKNIEIYREPGCRVMTYGQRSQTLIVSQKSSQNLFPGYGVRFMNVNGFHMTNNFLHMSQKQIRDLSVENDGQLVVATSREKVAKLYSIPNKCQVMTFTPSDKDLWSVAFDFSRPKYMYLGSQNSTYVYDIRSPHTYIHDLSTPGDMSPVISINSVPYNEEFSFGGFIVCKLLSVWFYEYTASQDIIPHKLKIDGKFNSTSYDEITKHVLISAGPSKKYPTTRHIVAALVKVDQTVVLRVDATILGSATQIHMCRSSTLMKVQDDLVVAAYSEDHKQLTMWDTAANTKMQLLPVSDTIFDTCPLYINQRVFLGALSETRLRLYQVN